MKWACMDQWIKLSLCESINKTINLEFLSGKESKVNCSQVGDIYYNVLYLQNYLDKYKFYVMMEKRKPYKSTLQHNKQKKYVWNSNT